MDNARLQFKNFQGFPEIVERNETLAFLQAASEIVSIIESFGKLFTPVVTDMNGNITKLTKIYKRDELKYQYLDDLIALNINVDKNLAPDALLWLKRALELIYTFFENIYYDAARNELLKAHLQNAYERTLKPFHGFLIQKTFSLIYGWAPTRSQLIGVGEVHEENLEVLAVFLPRMKQHLDYVNDLFKRHAMELIALKI